MSRHFVAQRVCERDGCSGNLSGYRADARYCSEACAKAARRAASADKGRTRRRSRDGLGTRVYLSGEDIVKLGVLVEAINPDHPLVAKLRAAAKRVVAKAEVLN